MQGLRKTVNICCLIYGIYGLISLIQLKSFIPPIPLRPLLIIVMLASYIYNIRFTIKEPYYHFSFLIWLFTFTFVGPYFMEAWGGNLSVNTYFENIQPLFYLISIVCFAIFCIFQAYKMGVRKIGLTLTCLACLLFIFFSMENRINFDWGVIAYFILFFILSQYSKKSKDQFVYGKIIVLNGVGIILLIERVTYLIH